MCLFEIVFEEMFNISLPFNVFKERASTADIWNCDVAS